MHHCLPTHSHEIRKRHPASGKCNDRNVKLGKSSRLRSHGQSNETLISRCVVQARPLPSGNCLLVYIIRITFWLSDTCRVTRAISRGKPSYRERMKNIVACRKVEQSALKTDLRSVRKQWTWSFYIAVLFAERNQSGNVRIQRVQPENHLNIQLNWRSGSDLRSARVDLILFFAHSSSSTRYIV